MPITVLEAMAHGKPVVATAVGGTPEVVVEGETGLLVPPGDPERLAAAIRSVLDDRELARRMGEAGRIRVAERFSVEAMTRARARDLRRGRRFLTVSVVIPTHGSSPYLDEAIASIRGADEILVVVDGASEAAAAQPPGATVLHLPRVGRSAARNAGVEGRLRRVRGLPGRRRRLSAGPAPAPA
jgi:hypothetical protein